MATVGNTARLQFNMAQVQTRYGSQLNSLYNTMSTSKYGKYSTATQSLNDLLNSKALKNKSSVYREQFSDLYKSIYGVGSDGDDASSVSTAQAVKSASANAGGAAQSIKSFANGLKYGGELDTDAYKSQAQSFVDSYNTMIDKVGNSDKNGVLQKGVLMVNTGKVYSSSLSRAGITVGADNKLSVNDDLSKVKASDVKFVFGSNGFSDKVIQKSRQINELSGGSGQFTVSPTTSNKDNTATPAETVDNVGTLKELTAMVKDAATAVKSYAHGLGGEEGSEFKVTDFTDTAKDFVEKYNNFVDEMGKSDKTGIRQKGVTMQSTARAYQHALKRAGISVGEDGKLTLADDLSNLTAQDVKYAFAYGGFTDKVAQKADQVKSLATSASAMGYNSNRTSTYAYNTGALYSVYA
ncbi:MAG: hypothetical protein NC299_08520 [Lachnospiraceae bacterium]|nr:hypothetical protein [Ruminococcus sp.]MCM1275396.1 hypothetical protein [Lachnospiraceae bacterium]